MRYRRVGRTGVRLSTVGFGTCQLRLVPEPQAVAALERGFELGVNWVHTSPDYGGAEELVAQAIQKSGREVIPVSDGSGDMGHFEHLFERTCRLFDRRRLPMWGISCIDDQEFVGHNVWGAGGMVEFVSRRKREGRIEAVYCTTHGPPDYVARIITCGFFDAVMLAYNPLGFHVLSSFAAAEGKAYEDIPANGERILALAKEHGVAVLVMKPLAGGLLVKSAAFPPHEAIAPERERITAGDVLSYILGVPGVTAVVPGVACVAEAEEDARAGHVRLSRRRKARARALESRVAAMRTSLCSRCGKCEPTCSQGLPISWLFRDAYIWMNPGDTFDAVGRLHYFHLHPEAELECASCREPTCACPQGLDIPRELQRVHTTMTELRMRGLLPRTPAELESSAVGDEPRVRVVYAEVPSELSPSAAGVCRFWLENAGARLWARREPEGDRVLLRVRRGHRWVESVPLREDVHPGRRTHVTFEIHAPQESGLHAHEFLLCADGNGRSTEIHRATVAVEAARAHAPAATPPPPTVAPPSPPAYGVRHVAHNLPERVAPGQVFAVRLDLENTGTIPWRASSPVNDHVGLAVFWDDRVLANHMLPRPEVRPGERVTLHFAVEAPLEPGVHRLALKMVQYNVTVFEDRGALPLIVDITVEDRPPDPSALLWAKAQRVDPWHYLPTRGLSRSADGGTYPVFAQKARGCHLWDLQGKRYVDYTMGWGSVLLGYAHPQVSEAIASMLETGPTVAWPQPVEIEVAEMLTEDFPSAEMVCFGKNGSDACTFAVRMARVLTGRRTILFSGYHGWQDFWVEQVGFGRSGVPPRDPPLIHRFPFHDPEAFRRLYDVHRGDLAAVMVEPSPWIGEGIGFAPDTDVHFLRTVADAAREAGALFILDEILTGYRYSGHSVQKAKGVIPDLTCLGKAIASGMPLSAVVGREPIFKEALPKTFYAATFRGESYSFAAARAAIRVYREEPVASHVWSYGERLRSGIHALCRELGVDARLTGPPFRMSFIFGRSDSVVRHLERSLFQQELLKAGVTTANGVMLPCYAHDDDALAATFEAFGRALEVVARTARRGDWDDALEIPPILDL